MIPKNLTGKEYLEYLTDKEKKRFRTNLIFDWKFYGNDLNENFHIFITSAFVLSGSPEGETYWMDITKRTEKP